MTDANVIAVRDLLDKHVSVSEVACGRRLEHAGRVVGIIEGIPGLDVGEAITLLKTDGTLTEWLHLSDLAAVAVVPVT